MNKNTLVGMKEHAAQTLANSNGNDLPSILSILHFLSKELSQRQILDPMLNLLLSRAEKFKRDVIAGVVSSANQATQLENLQFALEKYLESSHQFQVIDFAKDYSLAQEYARQIVDVGKIEEIKGKLSKARKQAQKALEYDTDGGIEAIEEGLILIETEILAHKIIDKDYLNLKHRYISLKLDLMNGIIPSKSDFFNVLANIKEATNLYLMEPNSFSNTNLIQGAMPPPTSKPNQQPITQTNNQNPLAPFPDEEIYNEYMNNIKMLWLKLSSRMNPEEKLLRTYIVLSQEVSRRKMPIKASDKQLVDQVSKLLPLNLK